MRFNEGKGDVKEIDGPTQQQHRPPNPPPNPDEVMQGIQQEQGMENRKGTSRKDTSTEQRVETLRKDFWTIPLKDRLMIWATFLFLLTGIVTAWVFIRQLGVMQDTLIEIKGGGEQTERLVITGLGQMAVANRTAGFVQQQAEATHQAVGMISNQTVNEIRAWVGTGPIGRIPDNVPIQPNIEFSYIVPIFNSGKSPARIEEARMRVDIVKGEPSNNLEYQEVSTTSPSRMTIFPGAPPYRGRAVYTISDEQFKTLSASTHTLILYGKIKYRDTIVNRIHTTKFCVQYAIHNAGVFEACKNYNYAD
jgi:hypothetical protein